MVSRVIFFILFPIFYCFFNNDALLTYPCLLSLTSIIIVTFLFWFVVKKILRSNEKSVIVLYFLGMFFWLILPVSKIFKSYLLKHVIVLQFLKNNLAILWVFIILFFLYVIRSSKNIKYKKINRFFEIFTVIFAVILVLNIPKKILMDNRYFSNVGLAQKQVADPQRRPNIYHILLDAHSSNYVLKKYYNFDNNEFYQNLRNKGFSMIEPSFSQYPATQMSVASMLNLEYLPASGISATDLEFLRFNNKVFSTFRENGYRVHVFDRTLQISYGKQFKKANNSNYALYWLWIQHTPLKWLFQRLFQKEMCLDHSNNIELDLQELELAKKKFGSYNNLFYAHIVCPHAPFIYKEDGVLDVSQGLIGVFTNTRGALAENNEHLKSLKQKYLSTLKIIDRKILKLVQAVLSQYEENEKPIIILHSDHGTCLTTISPLVFDFRKLLPQQLNAEQEQLYGNLLTIYCPNSWQPEKVPLSLVNLYRFVFNNLFNEKYEYLENFCCIKD